MAYVSVDTGQRNGIIPSYSMGFAKDASLSLAPELREGLVLAYLPFLGPTAGVLLDWSGGYDSHGIHDGVLVDKDIDSDWQDDYMGSCLHFSNSYDERVDTETDFEWIFKSSFSISMLIRLDDGRPGTYRFLFGFVDSATNNGVYSNVNTNGQINFYYESNGNGVYAKVNGWLDNGKTPYLCLTWVADSTIHGVGGLKIYVNGREEFLAGTDRGDTTGITFADFSTDKNFYVGNRNRANVSRAMGGQLSEFLMWDRALSSVEAQDLANEPFSMWEPRKWTMRENSPSSTAHSTTVEDTIILSDSLNLGARINFDDGVSLADSLNPGVGLNLSDGVSLADDLDVRGGAVWFDTDVIWLDREVQWYPPSYHARTLKDRITLTDDIILSKATVELADNIILTDQLASSVQRTLEDIITLTDDLIAGAHITLADIIFLNDALVSGNQVLLGDFIHLSDALEQVAGINLADIIRLTDLLVTITPSILLQDFITLTDAIINIIPGVSNVAVGDTIKNWSQPIQWEKAVSSNPSSLSGITDSSENTTFGQENPYTVLDAGAWDLSKVELGYIAVTTSGFMGIVISIGANTIRVQNWTKGGIGRVYGATDLPKDGESVTIHYRLRAKRVLIRSKEGNSNTIYVEPDGRYMDSTSGHPIIATQGARNSELEISAPRDRWLNLSRIWVVSFTSQTAVVIVDGKMP